MGLLWAIFKRPLMCPRRRSRTILQNWLGLGWCRKDGAGGIYCSVDYDEMRALIGFLTEECCAGVNLEQDAQDAA